MRTYKILFIIFLIVFIGFLLHFVNFISTPLLKGGTASVVVILQPKTPLKTFAYQLTEKNLLSKPRYFIFLAYLRNATKKVQAGEYEISLKTTPWRLLQKLITGEVVLHTFTIYPGWTFKRMLAELEKNPYLSHSIQNLTSEQIMTRLGHVGETAEGRFLPESYRFSAGVDDIAVLRQAYDLMQAKLAAIWENRNPNLPYVCSYKALIVASIIEKEAADPKERRIIAGIVAKRLQLNMYLQLDPTLLYGLAKKPGEQLTIHDLKVDNSYNTYRYKGIPPTPICMPSADSLEAALNPIKTKYLYFVAKGDGTHEFSESLKAHIKAIAIYQS